MTQQEKTRCSARVYDIAGWHTSQCMKNATVERDGKDYCKTHDPVRKAERRDKRIDASRAAYVDKQARRDARKVEFVDRVVAIRLLKGKQLRVQAAKLVDDIVVVGMSWARW